MLKKLLSMVLVWVLVLSAFTSAPIAADNGPENSYSYLLVAWGNSTYYLYYVGGANNTVDKPDGIDYDKSSNTLTLNNYADASASITGTNMGDDFTINVKGANELKTISFSGYDYTSSAHFTGKGSITLNKDTQSYSPALMLSGTNNSSKITIEKSVKVDFSAPEGIGAIGVSDTFTKNAIDIKGSQAAIKETKKEKALSYSDDCIYGFDSYYGGFNTIKDMDGYTDSKGQLWGAKKITGSNSTFYKLYKVYEITTDVNIVEIEKHWDANAGQDVDDTYDEIPNEFQATGKKMDGYTIMPCWDSLTQCTMEGSDGTFVYRHFSETDGQGGYYDNYCVFQVFHNEHVGNVLVKADGMYEMDSLPSTIKDVTSNVYTYELASNHLVLEGENDSEETTTSQVTTTEQITTSNEMTTEQTTTSLETTKAPQTTKEKQTTGADTNLVPKAVSIKKITAKKKSLKVTWKSVAGVSGYQVKYAKKKNFKGAKTKTINNPTATSITIKKLSKKKKYFVKIRSFVTANGKTNYSVWSKAKSKKTK